MAGGTLAARDALAALGTGLFVGNLHYLNYSDRPACRMTGHDALRDVLGRERQDRRAGRTCCASTTRSTGCSATNLEALTAETELILESGTYRERALASMRLPGALLSELTFTL